MSSVTTPTTLTSQNNTSKQCQQAPESKPAEMSNGNLLKSSGWACIKEWPYIFKDIANGDDMQRWIDIFHTHLAVLLGAKRKHVGPSPALLDNDNIRFIAPCFFDENPIPYKEFDGSDKKVKFNSNFVEGFLLVLDSDIVTIRDRDDINAYEIHRNPISEMEIHELRFKMSKLSMTSAGKGYEIIFPDHRVLFRIGLGWRDIRIGGQLLFSNLEKEYFLDLLIMKG